MKSILKNALMISLGVLLSISLNAQKFGYVDSGAVLESMPEVKEAESNLEALGKQLQAKGEKMVQDFQLKVQDFQRRVQAGDITPKDQQTESASLEEEQNTILQYDNDMQQQLAQKREELLTPILEKVKNAINEVAKTNAYTYVFDGSPNVGVILYADESSDITGLVKKQLGITE